MEAAVKRCGVYCEACSEKHAEQCEEREEEEEEEEKKRKRRRRRRGEEGEEKRRRGGGGHLTVSFQLLASVALDFTVLRSSLI